jgi:hypothetical protein
VTAVSTLAEVRRAVRAERRAAEQHKQARARRDEVIRAAMLAGQDTAALVVETGMSQQRLHQIREGVRTQKRKNLEDSL